MVENECSSGENKKEDVFGKLSPAVVVQGDHHSRRVVMK